MYFGNFQKAEIHNVTVIRKSKQKDYFFQQHSKKVKQTEFYKRILCYLLFTVTKQKKGAIENI